MVDKLPACSAGEISFQTSSSNDSFPLDSRALFVQNIRLRKVITTVRIVWTVQNDDDNPEKTLTLSNRIGSIGAIYEGRAVGLYKKVT